MRQAILCVGLLLLAGCDWEDFGSSDRYSTDFHYNYPLKSGGRVSLESFNGSVEIMGWDEDQVDIAGAKYGSTPEARDAIRIDVTPSSDTVTIRTVRPSDRRNIGARYVVKVPHKVQLERIVTSNGSLRLSGVDGAARVKTSNGSVRAQHIGGNLDAITSNGSIEISEVKGDATVKTSNGHVKIDGVNGAVDASTSNGGVDVEVDQLHSGGVRASTSNSGITLYLPGTVNARLIARTSNAPVSADFDVTSRVRSDKHHLEGIIGSGGPTLDLSTSNGRIRVARR
jgi:hypothetical protein